MRLCLISMLAILAPFPVPSAQVVYYHCAQFHGECTLAPKFISTRIKEFSKMVRVFVPVLAAAFAFACVARAQTVDEVIAKNIQAHGGIEKLKAIHTARTTAKYSQGSFHAQVVQ